MTDRQRIEQLEERVAELERDTFDIVSYLLQTFTGYVHGSRNKAMLRGIRARLRRDE